MMLTALAVLGAFALPVFLLRPAQVSRILDIYPGYERLDQHYFLLRSLGMKHPPRQSDQYTVAVIGGSTTRESIIGSDALSQQLTQITGRKTSVVDLTSSGQKLNTSAMLAVHALCNGADLALVGVGLGRFGSVNRNDRTEVNFVKGFGLNISGSDLDALGLSDPPTAVSERRFVAASLVLTARYLLHDIFGIYTAGVRKKATNFADRHMYIDRKFDPEAVPARLRQAEDNHVSSFLSDDKFLTLLTSLAAASKACGGTLMLFDTPLNPRLRADAEFRSYAVAYEAYRQKLRGFSDATSVPHFSLNDEHALSEQDFFDFGHLRTREAIAKTNDIVAREVAGTLMTRNGGVQARHE